MSADQASTARLRESGRMCWSCKTLIELRKWPGGERLCERCARPQKVWLRYKYVHTFWEIEFLEPKHWMTVGRKRRFDSADTIRELVGRTLTRLNLEAQHAFEHGLQTGYGQIELELTGEQYAKLRK